MQLVVLVVMLIPEGGVVISKVSRVVISTLITFPFHFTTDNLEELIFEECLAVPAGNVCCDMIIQHLSLFSSTSRACARVPKQ